MSNDEDLLDDKGFIAMSDDDDADGLGDDDTVVDPEIMPEDLAGIEDDDDDSPEYDG